MFSFHYFKLKNGGWINCLPTPFQYPENNVSIYLLRTPPRFSSATRPLYFPQLLRYPFGRDYSATPISLRRERKLIGCCRTTSSKTGVSSCLTGVFNSVNLNESLLRNFSFLTVSSRVNDCHAFNAFIAQKDVIKCMAQVFWCYERESLCGTVF